MKDMTIESVQNLPMETIEEISERLDRVLAKSEQLLQDINDRLDKINSRQDRVEELNKQLEGTITLKEWKEKGVK